jgi:16S rRNA (guanine1207-N2)-methyltransferase
MRVTFLMIDNALQIIHPHLKNLTAPTLWFADENAQPLLEFIPYDEHLTIVTNRFDIYQQATIKKIKVVFSDFNSDDYPAKKFQKIVYRISKEKALVHNIINQSVLLITEPPFAHSASTANTCLIITGFKNEGIKSYADKIKSTIRAQGTLKKYGGCYCGEFSRLLKNTQLDDKNYANLKKVIIDNNKTTNASAASFYSKPGVFGWNKIDKGTELLLASLKKLMHNHELKPSKVLDLGCGYGWIFLNIDQYGFENITATDNNAAAIIAAQKNAQVMKTSTTTIASDCADTIEDSFDLILCNPPFHQGFQHTQTLTDKFIRACCQKAKKNGHVLLVTNEFVAFDRLAKRLFTHKKTLLKEQGFKVTLLTK